MEAAVVGASAGLGCTPFIKGTALRSSPPASTSDSNHYYQPIRPCCLPQRWQATLQKDPPSSLGAVAISRGSPLAWRKAIPTDNLSIRAPSIDWLVDNSTPCKQEKGTNMTVAIKGDYVEVCQCLCRLRVYRDGRFELLRSREGIDMLVTKGQLQLPTDTRHSAEYCKFSARETGGEAEVRWGDAVLRVTVLGEASGKQAEDDGAWLQGLDEGFLMTWTVSAEVAEVTLDMDSSGHWFGAGHFMKQHWPLNRAAFEVGPFLPFDNGPNGINTLTSPQWVTSSGLLLLADADMPFFHVGMNAPLSRFGEWIERVWGVGVQNLSREYLPSTCEGEGDGLLRLQARSSYKCHRMLHPLTDWMPNHHKKQAGPQELTVKFALSGHQNVKEATLAALRTMKKPPNPPPRELVTSPIWTTWARYHAKVTQAKVEQYAKEIVSRDLPRSVMEIDDRWQLKYGDFDFDPVKFPDPKAMVARLHELGFKVTLWIMPFAEEDSQAYREGGPKGYFIASDGPATKGLKPGFFHWWQPKPAVALDVTNPEAVSWFVGRLKKMQEDYAIDGFKFDAGEPCFLPPRFRTFAPINTPLDYTRLWVEAVASNFPVAEVRTGHRTTSVPLLTRMGDRFSTWGSGNGLRSVIPTLLTSGLLGYPFCLPDMIGGNAYFGRKPDMELLVRWAQANALMPAMQFSIAPWDLSKEADKLCRAALEVRKHVGDKLVSLAEEACKALAPICRPIWWLDPEDEQTFQIGDQFAIGDDLIVAPVVVKGQRQRDVYLPKGLWCELLQPGEVYEGPMWIRQLEAPLHKLPVFRRVKPAELEAQFEKAAAFDTLVTSPFATPVALDGLAVVSVAVDI